MKKYLFLAATAMMFAACSNNEVDAPKVTNETPQAVAFDTYTADATRAGDPYGVMTTSSLKTTGKGFGVFAYYTDNGLYDKVASPVNFMFNEHVSWTAANGWGYSPLKYWPNETIKDSQSDSSNPAYASSTAADRLSFFAYAPYVSLTVAKDDYLAIDNDAANNIDALSVTDPTTETGISAMSTNAKLGDPLVEWKFSDNLDQNTDLLWGVAPMGMAYQSVNPTNPADPGYINKTFGLPLTDMLKPDKDQKMKFLFQHALSRIGLSVVSAIDQISAGDDANTFVEGENRVLIEKVEISGPFGIQGTLNLNNSSPNIANWVTGTVKTSPTDVEAGTPTAILTIENSHSYVATALLADKLYYDAVQVGSVTGAANASAAATKFAALNAGVQTSEDVLLKADASSNPRYMMVIPTGSTNIKVKITYHVLTLDTKLSGYISDVTNVITKGVTLDLKNGKSYNLKLVLGLTSVKLDAEVADWQVDGSTEVYLPQNKE